MKRLLGLFVILLHLVMWACAESEAAYTQFEYVLKDGTVTITKYIGQDLDIVVPAEIDGIPVTGIGAEAFDVDNCWDFRSIRLPEGIVTIGDGAFYNCGNLKELVLPNSLVNLGGRLFCNSGITNISIPASVKSIGAGVFASAENLVSVTIDPQNTRYQMIDGVLYDMVDKRAVSSVLNLIPSSHVVPEGIVVIDDYAFFDCYHLESVILPEGLKTIGASAFAANNSKLKSIRIPDSVTTIGVTAFFGSGLEQVGLPKSLRTLGKGAFVHCYSLQQVEIANGITEIPENAFYCCGRLRSVTIPASVKTIGDGAFSETAVETVEIPYGVERIGNYAFASCKNMKTLEIPGSVTEIGEGAFDRCPQDMTVVTEPGSAAEKVFADSGVKIEYEEFAPPRVPGDADDSGNVDVFDALLILQHAVGWDVTINLANADVDESGADDVFDALLVLQYTVGWDVILK